MRESSLFFRNCRSGTVSQILRVYFAASGEVCVGNPDSDAGAQFHKSRVGFADPALACLWLCDIRVADSRQSIR